MENINELRKAVIAGKKKSKNRYYNTNSLFGNDWAQFYMILGAGGTGKSYSVMKHCVSAVLRDPSKNKMFWARLSEEQCKKLLARNGAEFLDPDLYRKFGKALRAKSGTIEYGSVTQEGGSRGGKVTEKFHKEGDLCKVMPLSTFFNNKGQALFDNEFEVFESPPNYMVIMVGDGIESRWFVIMINSGEPTKNPQINVTLIRDTILEKILNRQ